jgi:hypothetical protein
MLFQQSRGNVAGRTSEQVGQYQDTIALVEFAAQPACLAGDMVRVTVTRNPESLDPKRGVAEDAGSDTQQLMPELVMGYQ